ncbi:uroporphyrinogen-III synthase [Aquimarina sediminis]|uniref:uroporphyrinogen-III synthase n=1 Tax=Aquimarina sediminis TaxID=2070536 RepID=UPI000CA01C8D|nr:uroporphyrinogen-III synthase [Aquimarina sediminis]
MNTSPTILSTKKLSVAQKELLSNADIKYVEYEAIEIELLETQIEKDIQNAIFTSKNAFKAIKNIRTNISKCFCVGENTKKLLEENGLNIVETAQNAFDLAQIIIKKYKNESFLFFCGNLRRNELPDLLNQNKIDLKEQVVYKTHLKLDKFDRSFDGILFFSPSGIQSYVSENTIEPSIAFCIGNTTAAEARKYAATTVVASKPSVEDVIVQAIEYFRNK